MLLGADDDDLGEVGDGGDDPGCELDPSVDLIDLEDVVAGLVASLDESLHVMVNFLGSEMDLGKKRPTEAASSLRISWL